MPLVTTNLRADYDIDALGLSNGTAITSCPDQTANARDLAGPSSHRPTSENSGGPKGKRYAQFSGNEILRSTATDVGITGTAERVVFCVFRCHNRTPAAANIVCYGPAGSGGAIWALGTNGGDDNVIAYYWSLNSSSHSTGNISQWHIVALQQTATGHPRWWIDGVDVGTDGGVSPNTGTDVFNIGGRVGDNGDFTGDVARVLVHGALTDGEIADQFAYLTATYVTTFQDVATRFNLQASAPAYADVSTRLSLAAQGYRDLLTRLKLRVQGYRDVATRFNLNVYYYKDVATRFNLQTSQYAHVATRFALRATKYTDVATRFNLATQAADVLTRLVLRAIGYQDVATRFNLFVRRYADVATRFKINVAADVHTRFKLASAIYHDVATRLHLKVAHDVRTRFHLAPAFFGLEQPHGTLAEPLDDSSDPVIFGVDDTQYFRTSNGFRIRIGNEVLKVTNGAGTSTWTALRAQDGTEIEAHSFGDVVEQWTLFSIILDYFGTIYVHTWDAQKFNFTRQVNGGDGQAKWHIDMPRPLNIPRLGSKVMIIDDEGTQWLGRLEELTGDFYPDYASLDFVAHGYASQATDLTYQPAAPTIFTMHRSLTITQMFKEVAVNLLSGVGTLDTYMQPLGRTMPAETQDFANQNAQTIFNSLCMMGNVGDQPVMWGIRSFGTNSPYLEVFQDTQFPFYYVNADDCTATMTSWRLTDVFNSVRVKYALGQVTVRSTPGVAAIGGVERQLVVDFTDKISSIGQAQYIANTLLEKHSSLHAQGVQITIPYPSPVYYPDGVTRAALTQLQYGRRISIIGADTGDSYYSVESQLIHEYTWDDDRREVTLHTQRVDSIIDILDKILNQPDTLQKRPPDPGNRVTPPRTEPNPPVTAPASRDLPTGGIDGPGGVAPFIDPATGRLAGPANTPGFDVADITFAIGVPDTALEASKSWGPAIIDFKCRVVGLRVRALNQDGDYSGAITIVISKQNNAASTGVGETIKTVTLDGNGYLEENWAADVAAGDEAERLTSFPAHSALYYTVSAVSGHKIEQVTLAFMVRRDPEVGDSTAKDAPADTTPPAIFGNVISLITTYSARLIWTTGEDAILDGDGNETTPATGEVTIGWVEFGFEQPDFNYATVSQSQPVYNDGYGSSMPADGTFSRVHIVDFSGLAPGTTYHYRIHYFDRSYNQSRTDDGSFTTLAGN